MEILPGDYPSSPPKGCPPRLADGWHVVEFESEDALNAMAQYLGVNAYSEWNTHKICGAAVVSAKIVLMLSAAATQDQGLYNARLVHEYAHTHGYTHPADNARKWLDPEGRPVD